MTTVTVIIPAYNAMEFLPQTLDSVLQQSYTEFEVLVVNDGSRDSIIDWFKTVTDKRVHLISQDNQGLPGARNTGISKASGQYLAFLDADDLWETTKLEKQINYFKNKPEVGVVYTWSRLVDENNIPTGRIFASQAEGDIWEKLLFTDVISNGSSAMVRRECFEEIGGFDQNLTSAEDLDMWLRIASKYSFGVGKEALTRYRVRAASMSRNQQRMVSNLRAVLEKNFQSVPLEKLPLRSKAYASIYLNLAWSSIDIGDYKEAIYNRTQAKLHFPKVIYSHRFLRLGLAIYLVRYFGAQGYDNFRSFTHQLKIFTLGFFSAPSKFTNF